VRGLRTRELEGGSLLQAIAVGHALVGMLVYRRELGGIARGRVFGAVGYRSPRATAFWFLVPSPLLWALGGLLARAEAAGEHEAVRSAARIGAATALTGVVVLPLSGFWGLLAVCVRTLRRAR
jgi:hypothetical protein